jgi:hypothetical protein
LKEDLKFQARFLATHVVKMKRDRVLRAKSFNGDCLKKKLKLLKKNQKELDGKLMIKQ